MSPINRTKGEMYPDIYGTWNPIRGCEHDCIYCSLKSMHPPYDMTPRFEEKLLEDNLGSGRTIFVGSTTDIGGKWIKQRQVLQVLDHCKRYANKYLFQSKNPVAFLGYTFTLPKGCILGTTIETNRDIREISKAPSPTLRAMGMARLSERRARDLRLDYRLMISIEPILDFDLSELVAWIAAIHPNYVSIGADSKNHNLREPGPGAVESLIDHLREITEVKLKPNLKRLVNGSYFESNRHWRGNLYMV